MKTKFICLSVMLLLAGCIQDTELIEPSNETGSFGASEIHTRSLDGVVYNAVTDVWMIPQPDPYTLDNFQKTYDNIVANKSSETFTEALAAEFVAEKKLKPTHYALRIYPKSEDEQWKVETMEDVNVAYIPFNYAQLTHEEVEKVTKTKPAANTFTEKSPYTVTHNYTDVTDGGPTGPVTYQLPILYTVWPVDKPLPDELEYVIDYEVFLPSFQQESAEYLSLDALRVLENEAVTVALGYAVPILVPATATRAPYYVTAYGTMNCYDNVLGQIVPMPNLKLQYQRGSNIVNFQTDSNGGYSYTISESSPPSPSLIAIGHSAFNIIFQDPAGKWKITTPNSTNPYTFTTDIMLALPGVPAGSYDNEYVLPANSYNVNEIHRAVNYFYRNQTVFPKYYPSGGTRIIAHDVSGRSNYSSSNHYINIYGYGRTSGDVVGSALHELGHLVHDLNDQYPLYYTHTFLYESFACYASWYLGHEYYKSLGWVSPYPSYDITTRNARQAWEKIDAMGNTGQGEYSPLFVDLTDNYNQGTNNTYRPNDNIQGVLPSVVWSIASTSYTWTQCRAKLLSYAGTGTGKYYTTAQFNEWIAAFDNWVNLYY
ncbi:MAG: hypothetical protein LBV47_09150 [Bacteroidales bacterium]|jgi:hypothetical protein|nr:hypothetical protein [Bacteroidales bacterium]